MKNENITDPAYSAAHTVELLLVLVVIQLAVEAEVSPELSPAALAALLDRLPQPADAALNLK